MLFFYLHIDSLHIYILLLCSSFAPSSYSDEICHNDDKYRNTKGKSCRWVWNKPVQRRNQCAREEVWVNCPQSCGLCCMDDPFYSFTTNMRKERDCTWLGRKETTKDRYCGEKQNGGFVEDFCQVCVRWYVCDSVYKILYCDVGEHVDVIEQCCDASTVLNLFLAFFGSLQLFIYACLTGTMRSV